MTARNDVFVSTLVEALSKSGVQHACVSPGSRNTPLSIALAEHPRITDWSHHDERSSGFFALGLAKTTGLPVAIVTTSGTAAAELYPAVVEASAVGVPLVILTADRPTELFDVSAPQTIDQRAIYGRAVRWHHDLDVPEVSDAGPRVTAALGARLVAEALTTPTGPVHLNIRFREPLVIEPDFRGIEVPEFVIPSGDPFEGSLSEVAAAISGRRGLILAGPSHDPDAPGGATALATALGWPIMSDPISGLRAGPHDTSRVVGSDLLASAGYLAAAAPEAVVRIGAPPTSKAVRSWLAHTKVPQIVVGPAAWPDPEASATTVVRARTGPVLRTLANLVDACAPEWGEAWSDADGRASRAARVAIDGAPFPSEPAVAATLARSTRDGTTIWAGSSMPIRDLDSYFPVSGREIRLIGNRGANGIDGVVSSALGSAAGGTPTVAHVGDLSLLHDIGALATAQRLDLAITIVVVNNDGGGIFHFLPQAGHVHFERHFGTPHGLSFARIAESFGVDSISATTVEELHDSIGEASQGPRVIEVMTDRVANVTLHQSISADVRAALNP